MCSLSVWSTAAQGFQHCCHGAVCLQASQNLGKHLIHSITTAQPFLSGNNPKDFARVQWLLQEKQWMLKYATPGIAKPERELLNGLPLAWLVAEILFMEWPNAVSWQAPSNRVLLELCHLLPYAEGLDAPESPAVPACSTGLRTKLETRHRIFLAKVLVMAPNAVM